MPTKKRALPKFPKVFLYLLLPLLVATQAQSQALTLKEAIRTAQDNYGVVKAKGHYLKASQASAKANALEYLPNLSVAAQQAYGTVNGQFGPLVASGGLNAASSGPPFPTQNWNAAFGGLYLANLNWDVFTFGRARQRNQVAQAQVQRDIHDLEQEQFQHQVRVASAYLNLLAAQRLKRSQQRNLERANALRTVVVVRAKNGLNPGVDSSLANAEVSSARIALTNARTFEWEQANQLIQLMGIPYQEFLLDTFFVSQTPAALAAAPVPEQGEHPVLKFYLSRLQVSRQQEKYLDRFKYPVLSFQSVVQSRGSGFGNTYNELHPEAFSRSYWEGIRPVRSNYLVGMGLTWNLTSPLRVRQQVASQEWLSKGLEAEYELASQQLQAEKILADQRMSNALANSREAPVQMKAASDAYLQKSVLYKNGLSTIVDVTQALYALNRAETDRDISNNNVWQALLLKAAASGDFRLFLNEF